MNIGLMFVHETNDTDRQKNKKKLINNLNKFNQKTL